MKATAKVHMGQLDKSLHRLAVQFDNEAVGSALEKGGAVIERQAKINVHVISGDLQRSIKTYPWTVEGGGVEVKIGTGVVYARVEEFGHVFEVTEKQRAYLHANDIIHLRDTTTQIVRKSHPYLRPAFYSKLDAALKIVAEELRKLL